MKLMLIELYAYPKPATLLWMIIRALRAFLTFRLNERLDQKRLKNLTQNLQGTSLTFVGDGALLLGGGG
jgi:hypothetical protein